MLGSLVPRVVVFISLVLPPLWFTGRSLKSMHFQNRSDLRRNVLIASLIRGGEKGKPPQTSLLPIPFSGVNAKWKYCM